MTYLNFIPTWLQFGIRLRPRRLQDVLKTPQRGTQDGPRAAQEASKMVKNRPQAFQGEDNLYSSPRPPPGFNFGAATENFEPPLDGALKNHKLLHHPLRNTYERVHVSRTQPANTGNKSFPSIAYYGPQGANATQGGRWKVVGGRWQVVGGRW